MTLGIVALPKGRNWSQHLFKSRCPLFQIAPDAVADLVDKYDIPNEQSDANANEQNPAADSENSKGPHAGCRTLAVLGRSRTGDCQGAREDYHAEHDAREHRINWH